MRRIIVAAAFIISLCLISGAYAEQKGSYVSPRLKRADRNKDGAVDLKERRAQKDWELKHRSQARSWWEKRADINGDGKIDPSEFSSWKKLERERLDLNKDGTIDAKERRLAWKYARSQVNTETERKYDSDKNGWLSSDEMKELLKDRLALVKSNGQAKVDTEIESEYDTDKNGIVDEKEAEILRQDMK